MRESEVSTMRRGVAVLLGAVLAGALLSTFGATPATAAPNDVAAEFATTVNPDGSNTVTGTFTSTTEGTTAGYCRFVDLNTETGDETFPYVLQGFASPPLVGRSVSGADTSVPDGTYTIDWVCYTTNFDEIEATTGLNGTAKPVTLEVPAVPAPEAGCAGSGCLPTGSSGL